MASKKDFKSQGLIKQQLDFGITTFWNHTHSKCYSLYLYLKGRESVYFLMNTLIIIIANIYWVPTMVSTKYLLPLLVIYYL